MNPIDRTVFLFMIFLSQLASLACAQTVSYSLSDDNAKKQITFESQAPVENIDGVAEGVNGTLVMDDAKPNLALQAIVGVPVNRMQTGNDLRDQHLKSSTWLNAERYPGIRFELRSGSAAVTKKTEGVWVAKADGLFTLKGITKPMTVPVVIKRQGKMLTVTGHFTVHLEDFGVNGPIGIKMIGLKVSPDVQVNVNLRGVEDPGWAAVAKKKP